MAVERLDLAHAAAPWREEHLARYHFASSRLPRGGRVLDLACGTGEGTALLRDLGFCVVAMDLSQEACRRARAALGPSGAVVRGSGLELPLPDASVDAVVSFETVEHLPTPDLFLRELTRVLRPGGVLHLSTPNARVTNPGGGQPENPFHLEEFTPEQLRGLLPAGLRVELHAGQTLPASYGPAPFLPSHGVRRRGVRDTLQTLRWKLLLRLPRLRDPIHRWCTGLPFYPRRGDYRFEPEALTDAHVQYLICAREEDPT